MRADDRGFTLIELMVVVVVLGLLAAIGAANFISLQHKAKRAACLSHQHHIAEAATLWSIDTATLDGQVNVAALLAADYLSPAAGECPDSPAPDFDDYRATLVGGRVTTLECTVRFGDHQWIPRF